MNDINITTSPSNPDHLIFINNNLEQCKTLSIPEFENILHLMLYAVSNNYNNFPEYVHLLKDLKHTIDYLRYSIDLKGINYTEIVNEINQSLEIFESEVN